MAWYNRIMIDLSKVIKVKKPRKPRDRVKIRARRIAKRLKYAQSLNRNMPASEVWFWRKWSELGLQHEDDKPNVVVGTKIVDVLNLHFKYAIEIDGSYHDRPEQKIKDAKKDIQIIRAGFYVVRVRAYSQESLNECVVKIIAYKKEIEPFLKGSSGLLKKINQQRGRKTVEQIARAYFAKQERLEKSTKTILRKNGVS